jgi:hypothetical protein
MSTEMLPLLKYLYHADQSPTVMSLCFVDSLARGSTLRKGSISGGRIRTSFLMRYALERDEGTDVGDEGTEIRD